MEFVFKTKSPSLSRVFILACLFVFICVPLVFAERLSEPFDHSKWDGFLKTVVNERGEVNFELAKKHAAELNDYLDYFANSEFKRSDFQSHWPREEQLAAFLNIYHASLIKLILEYYPIKSVQDVPGFWDLGVVWIGNENSYSLNAIRERSLIGAFRDEKIHTALACAAKSCPGFPQEAFTGPLVEGQLYLASRKFVNSEDYVRIDLEHEKVYLSRILQWYAKDFKLDFGFTDEYEIFTDVENAVLSFVAYYMEDADKINFLEQRRYKIKYLPFDWGLNEWHSDQGTAQS